uniref:Uncharacterized protein n=1 Tax=Kalanchoe fedtschenkoi TaxID=63787 RepID=A0A7N0T5H8_KALFE
MQEMSAVVDWDDDDDTELCHEDDGFVYRRKRRRGSGEQPSASVPAQPDLERDRTRWRRNKLLKLKDRYRKEIHRWELISNSLRAMEDKTTQVAEEYVEATAAHLVDTLDSAAGLIDELLVKANTQEAAISHVSNLTELAESICSDLEEQWSKSYIDLSVWSSPRKLISFLCN